MKKWPLYSSSVKHCSGLKVYGIIMSNGLLLLCNKYYIPISCLQCLDFWEACQDGDIDTVQASLSAGVDVNVATPVS